MPVTYAMSWPSILEAVMSHYTAKEVSCLNQPEIQSSSFLPIIYFFPLWTLTLSVLLGDSLGNLKPI